MPKTLAKLPGFAHAQSLLPAYPFASSSGSGVGSGGGDDCSTVGDGECYDPWTQNDKEQIARAARSIAMALSMDADRAEMRVRSEDVRLALEDNLHQVKNPLQAMRTYAKVLQRHIAMEEEIGDSGGIGGLGGVRRDVALTTPKLLALAENMMVQSNRVVDLLAPMDSIVDALEEDEERRRLLEGKGRRVPLLGPSDPPSDPPGALVFSRSSRPAAIADKAGASNSALRGRKQRMVGRDGEKGTSADTGSILVAPELPPVDSSTDGSTSTLGDLGIEIAFVPDVLGPVMSASKAVAEDRGIKFEVRGMGDDVELPGVSMCPKSLQEAVANILDNAIKYVVLGKGRGRGVDVASNPNPRVRVTLAPNHEPYKAGVTILIEDNGPGIP